MAEAEQDLHEAEQALKAGDNEIIEIAAIRTIIAAYQGNVTQLRVFPVRPLKIWAGTTHLFRVL